MKKNEKNVNEGKKGNLGSGLHDSPGSHHSHSPPDPPPDLLLPPRGDYQTLLSFQKAEVIYDITFRFAHKFLAKSDRTIDQMIQTNYLIDQQVRRLAQDFLKEGGLRERMTRARTAYRNGRYESQGSNGGNAGRQGGGSPDGRSPPEAHSSPDSHSSQPQKPPGHRNPPRPGGQL
jgi:four helix bundle suffix protein